MGDKKEEKPIRVLGLHVENYKRIELADLVPNKRVTVIRGDNGQGKSSLGDAFVSAIGGKRVRPTEMLRRGAEEGRSIVDLGNDDEASRLRVELVFTADGHETFEVTNADGMPQRAPQELLNALIGPQRSQFDPIGFLALPAKEKAEHVRLAVGLDFTEIEKERQKLYDDRTMVGREVNSAKARLAALPRPSDSEVEPIDTMSLLVKQEEFLKLQREREQLAGEQREAKAKLNGVVAEFRAAEAAIERVNTELEAAKATVERLERELDAVKVHHRAIQLRGEKLKEEHRIATIKAEQAPDPDLELTMIRTKLEEAEKNTEAALKKKERERVAAELKAKEEEHSALERKLAEIDIKKLRMIAAAKFPLEGLGFSKGGDLTFKDLPFDQASQAEQLRSAVALGLSSKPRLRTTWIKQGSFLDQNSLSLLADALEEFDGQALVEVVGKEGKGPCIVIDAGRIVEVRK
jgi:DNA repair exonuclease SbcCD ATPase subunit